MDTECLYLSSYRLSSLTDQTWDSSVAFTYHHPPGRSCTICTWHCTSTLLLHDSCSGWPTIVSPAHGHSHRAEEIPRSCSQAWLLAGSRHARNLLLQCCHINWWTWPISPPCHLMSSSESSGCVSFSCHDFLQCEQLQTALRTQGETGISLENKSLATLIHLPAWSTGRAPQEL